MVSILSQMVKIFLIQTFQDKIDTFQYLNNINLSSFDKLISNERKAMKAIQILHYSLFGYILSLYLKYYFFKKNTKILQGHKINYKYKSSTYFIINIGSLQILLCNQKSSFQILSSRQFYLESSFLLVNLTTASVLAVCGNISTDWMQWTSQT